MANMIISEKQDEKQEEKVINSQDADWEAECYQYGCKAAREEAIRRLKAIDDRLFQQRPKSWKVEGSYKRTLVTRFGDLTVRRRLYQDDEGNYHFLLDEYLNWQPYQQASPSLTEALVDSATNSTFRTVSREVEKYSAGVLSASTVHRLLQKVTGDAISAEKDTCKSCFEEGDLPPPGEGKAPVLYVEADGIHVHLQREEQKRYELKNAIAYEGWERLSQEEERYGVVNKRVYCHSADSDSIPFWDGASLQWHQWWDLGYTNLIVLGGDDANWIDKGVDELPFCVRNLSGFHLSRSCRRGWKNGKEVYDTIRSDRVNELAVNGVERSGKTAQKERNYVLKRLEKGVDWRKKVEGTAIASIVPEAARGLGAIEGNESHLFSDRMKDRGMSWTIRGAQHMGKAIQLSFNGELGKWCGREPIDAGVQNSGLSFDLFEELDGSGKRTAIPALEGPHASRPWVRVLRDLTAPTYRVN